MIIRFNQEHKIFVAESSYGDAPTLKAAGFWWHPVVGSCKYAACKACAARIVKQWWSFKPEAAAKLLTYCDATAKAALQKTVDSLAGSRAADAVINVPCPAGLEYMPFQKAGIAYAANREGTLIADEMGLGKTIQAIGLINLMGFENVLVIVPASLRLNWKREIEKWIVNKDLTIAVVDSQDVDVTTANIVIVNYDRLKGAVLDALMTLDFDLIVLDEAHACKNTNAQRTKRVLGSYDRRTKVTTPGLIARAKYKLFLTGTPILNRPIELQPLVGALDPRQFGNFFTFGKRYCAASQTKFGWDFTGSSNLPELQERLRASIMVRRLKADVLTELPPKCRTIVVLNQNGLAAVVADESSTWTQTGFDLGQLHTDAELALASGDEHAYRAAVSKLDTALKVAFEDMSAVRHTMAVAKIPAVIDHCDELIEGGLSKLVIFAHHHDVINAIAAHYGATAVVVDGTTPNEQRDANVQRFQNDPNVTIFVGSIRAAGVGITLTAASHVVFAELDWTPGMVSQAEDRCHRIGQRDNVTVQHLVVDGSLDCRLAEVIVWKQGVIEAALNTQAIKEIPPPATGMEAPSALPMPKPRYPAATTEQRAACTLALQMLAGSCDGARKLDGAGFNKADAYTGRKLAMLGRDLTDGECHYCIRLLSKYHGQIGMDLVNQIKGKQA